MTETEKKNGLNYIDKTRLKGVWRLTYKLTNRMGAQAFGGRLISSYTDPLTRAPRHFYSETGEFMTGFFIQHQVEYFNPDENLYHGEVLDWLIGHPEVGVEQDQTGLSSRYMGKKSSNPRITLVNVDFQDIEHLEEDDYIDKLVGRIVLDSGQQALSLEKLQYILSALNLNYRHTKYITDRKIHKTQLRKTLKDYARRGYAMAEEVNKVIETLDEAKYIFLVKEMLRTEILYISNGMVKYEGQPLASKTDGVIRYFMENPDFFADLEKQLLDILKQEQQG